MQMQGEVTCLTCVLLPSSTGCICLSAIGKNTLGGGGVRGNCLADGAGSQSERGFSSSPVTW